MTKMLNVLESWINICGFTYLRLDGATKTEDRQKLTDRFNLNPKIFIFIIATRAGGLGINLTGADTVIFYDSDWNPTIDAQAQDRAHRIGQTREVHIYRLVSESTVEENILRKANQKRLLDSVVIQAGGFTTDFFKAGKDGIKELFGPSVVEEEEDAEPQGTEEPQEPAAVEPSKPARGRKRGGASAVKEVPKEPAAAAEGGTGARATPTAAELEAAMLGTQDDEDVEAYRREQRQAQADTAEFDESVPYVEEAEDAAGGHSSAGGLTGGETGAETGAESVGGETGAESVGGGVGGVARRRRGLATSSALVAAAPPAAASVDDETMADLLDPSPVVSDGSIAALEATLTPVQQYMLRFLEEVAEADAADAAATLDFERAEWELGQLQRRREEEEKLNDEDDELLFYEVRKQPEGGGKGRKGKGGAGDNKRADRGGGRASSSEASARLANVADYLQQQQVEVALEVDHAELQRLELSLWAPPPPPDRDMDEPYVSAPAGSSSDTDGGAARPRGGEVATLQFSDLVVEGAKGVARVQEEIAKRRRAGAALGVGGSESMGGARVSGRKRQAPYRMGEGDDDGAHYMEEAELLAQSGAQGVVGAVPRSHKKRPGAEVDDRGKLVRGGASGGFLSGAKGARAGLKMGGGFAGGARKDELGRAIVDPVWTAEEDAALLRTIRAFGNANWELVSDVLASLLPHKYR